MLTRTLLLAVLCTATPALWAATDQPGMTPSTPGANVEKAPKTFDEKFAHEAYMGNLAEVQMGQLAVQQSTNDQVKKFGQRMVDDHTNANKQLATVLTTMNMTAPTSLDKHHKDLSDKLAKLQGDAFDKSYMQHMVSDHKKDVSEYEHAIKKLKDDSLKAYATKTLPILQEHLKLAEDVHKSVAHGVASEGR